MTTLRDLKKQARQLRQQIITTCNANGGHLGGSLGAVDFTLALHQVFHSPADKIIFDVGHQAYAHKLLTGRADQFHTLRQQNGLSGFMLPSESPHDPCVTGHAGNSLSLATGLSFRDPQHWTIAVIGDGSFLNGMAVEALNHLATTKQKILIIINDNQYSIDPCVGQIATSQHYQEFCQSFSLPYTGPIDGHDFSKLLPVLRRLQKTDGPQVLHLKTQKGRGDAVAAACPAANHFRSPASRGGNAAAAPSTVKLQDFVGANLLQLAAADDRLCVITPAMTQGGGLTPFAARYPARFFDVGIAESHALALGAGLALAGKKPFCHFYASFLQRAFDQLIHDVAIYPIPLTLLIDRAGLVGEDGVTHQGYLAFSYLNAIPNLQILAPGSAAEIQESLLVAQKSAYPVAILYPKVALPAADCQVLPTANVPALSPQCLRLGQTPHLAVITTGFTRQTVASLPTSLNFSHYHLPQLKPLPQEFLLSIINRHQQLIVVEENSRLGGFGQQLADFIASRPTLSKPLLTICAIDDYFVPHASRAEQLAAVGLDKKSLEKLIYSQTPAVNAHFVLVS